MAAEKYVQEIGGLFNKFWGNLKDMPQDKILARVVSQGTRTLALLGAIHDVKIATVQCSDHWITEGRKYITQGDRELSPRLQQIVGERVEIAGRGPQDNGSLGILHAIPPDTECCLVHVPKSDGVFEREDFKTSVPDALQHTLFYQQAVRVSDQR